MLWQIVYQVNPAIPVAAVTVVLMMALEGLAASAIPFLRPCGRSLQNCGGMMRSRLTNEFL